MPPFRTILVAADFSESSREAFRVACSLAREDETRVIVLNVMEPRYVPELPTAYLGDQPVRLPPRREGPVGARVPEGAAAGGLHPRPASRRGVPDEGGGRRGGGPPRGRGDAERSDRDGDPWADGTAPAAGREHRRDGPEGGPLPGAGLAPAGRPPGGGADPGDPPPHGLLGRFGGLPPGGPPAGPGSWGATRLAPRHPAPGRPRRGGGGSGRPPGRSRFPRGDPRPD